MQPSHTAPALTRADVARKAWPIILANASVPLLGRVDTAVIGHYGSTTDLGALALGALLFNFIYWSFGFLRMSTTGFVAQADGAGDAAEVRAALARPLLMGLALGVCIWLLQWPLAAGWFAMMDASAAVAGTGTEYFAARVWGAPAALALYALCGALVGLGHGRALLAAILEELGPGLPHGLHLEVRASNAAARSLYHSLGFALIGARPAYYVAPSRTPC